ncbi:alpha/beta hydrolase [Patiriisocius marinistellae]|uniref:Alpha/beta hydrolase n=1 Tax=Patiriisocius marinistellae TaxID=2494560 RepID=A0A5J4G374_9FLAO|nr:alpha/beta fold hydrolase [Patiriisocius marinistellae]GEQ87379.1 alpha/beta hydrolase [Patiriisocius marinistellae]
MQILHSQIIGEGKPLVILHGFMGMGDNWKTMANQFANDGFEVHLVDQRNHGRSFHSDDWNYQLMADDLLGYCDEHELEHIYLMGHSMGGKVAMEFAAIYPDRIIKLVIADIGPKSYPQHHQDILKALSLLDFSKLKSRGAADDVLSDYIKDVGTRQFLLKNLYWKEKGVLALRVNLPVVSEKIEEVGKALSETLVFKGDTLFVRGAKSGYIEDEDEWGIKKQFPKSKIKTVSNAGHWLHAENPDEYYQIVMNFL